MHKYIKKAASFIRLHEYDAWNEFRLCAIIVAGGNILSVGFNQSRKHSYVEIIKENEWTNLHAEIDAILRARKKIDLKGTKMFVARMVKNNKHLAIARPCTTCQRAISSYGIKRVYYSIDDKTYATMTI